MKLVVRCAFPALFSMLLGACASTQLTNSLPSDAKIAVATPVMARSFVFANNNDLKTLIPIYGAAKMIQADRAEAVIERELAHQGFDVAGELQNALTVSLSAKGMRAQSVNVERTVKLVPSPKAPAQPVPVGLKIDQLPAADEARAWLDAQILIHGISAGFGGEFTPFIGLRIRMIDARSGQVLYDQRVAYNITGTGQGTNLTPVVADRWADIDAVKNDLPRVRAALITALNKLADWTANELAAR